MQSQKKHLLEGLIQAALLLSLCGLRVDVGLDLGPLAWSESLLLGPTSVLTPTHLHNLRNALEGGAELHPKHPDLDAFFTSRRLLGWVRSLDRLQVPQAELETWLVQLDPTPSPVRLHHTAPNRFILPEQTRDQDWTESGEEPREMEWEEPEDTHTQVYRRQGDTAEDMSPAHTQHMETQGTHGTQDWGREEPQDRGQAEDDQSSASLQECLRLLEAFPLTQEQQELVCNSGAPSTALAPLPAEDSAYMDQQWQDLLDLLEPQTPDVDMVDLLEQTSQLTPAAQGGPLMDGYLQHGAAASDQELLPLLPSDQLDDPTPAHLPSSLSSSLLPAQLLLGEEDLDEDLDGELEELLSDAQMLEEMSLLDLALEEGFGEELNERLEEQGYMDPELTQRTSQLSLMSRDRSRDKEEDVHTILPDVEEELDSDSGLSLDSSHSPASPSHSEASSYSSSSSSSSRPPVELQVIIKEEPLDEEELGAVGGHYNPQHESKHAFSSPFHPNQKLFEGFPWLEQISHDHTYNQPSQFSAKIPSKHLKSSPKHEKPYHLPKHLWSRDEKRARALKIPFSNELIINLPVEEFSDLLANYELNEDQLNLVRDIRRRGKNKIAAQNCRKRKMDTLQGLEKDVTMLRRRKSRLLKDKQEAMRTLQELKQRLTNLYQDVFSSLRDGEGRPLDVHEYMLSFESDGSVDVVSRRQGSKEKSRRKQKDKK